MRVFEDGTNAPMILGTVEELRAVFEALRKFLDADEERFRVRAMTAGNPTPYDRFLCFVEFVKTPGHVYAEVTEDNGLRVCGPVQLLERYIQAFLCTENHDHRHPELEFSPEQEVFGEGSLYPYIEADNEYEAEGYAFDA